MAHAYVEDYDSVVSEVIPLTRRKANTKRMSSGLSQCMNYEEGVSDSGYSSHSVPQSSMPAAEQAPEKEKTPSETSQQPAPPTPTSRPTPAHRRHPSQFAANAPSQIPAALHSRQPSKTLVRTGSPAVRNNRSESPASSKDDDSDCDCAKCRGADKKSPTSPLSSSWNLNYPPFNTARAGSVPPPHHQVLAHSFPSSYNEHRPHVPYHSRQESYRMPPPPAMGLEEEAIEEVSEPPQRPQSTRRGDRERMPRPLSHAGTSSNPVSSHSAWANAFNSSYYGPNFPPPPSSGPVSNLSSPPPPYQTYAPPPPPALTGNSTSSSPQTQPLAPYGMPPPPNSSSSAFTTYPFPYGAPPSDLPTTELAPMYPHPPSDGPPPPPSLSGSLPKSGYPMGPPPLAVNRRYSMRSAGGEMPPARDFTAEGSPNITGPPMPIGQAMGPPPLPMMNRRLSQRRDHPPQFAHYGEVPRSVSVPPQALHEANFAQDGRRRVNTPQPLLPGSRVRRDSNASSNAASSRLPPSHLSRFVDPDVNSFADSDIVNHSQSSRYSQQYHHPHHPHQQPRLLNSAHHDAPYGALTHRHGSAGVPRHRILEDDLAPPATTDYSGDDEVQLTIRDGSHDAVNMRYSTKTPLRVHPGEKGPPRPISISHRPPSMDLQYRYGPADTDRQLSLQYGERDLGASYSSSMERRELGEREAYGRLRSDSVIGEKREYILGEEPL